MSAPPIHPEAFTTAWLEGALGAPNGALRGFTFAPIGTGQMCQSFRLKLDWADPAGRPATIVAKCPSADPQTRATAQALRNYTLELSWYRELAGRIPVACPTCLHVESAEEDTLFALLLQDLSPARQGDQLAGATLAQIEVALEQAAALHAPYWGDPSLQDIAWLAPNPAIKQMLRGAIPMFYAGFRERYAQRLAPEILELGDALVARIDRYLDWAPAAATIMHGDFRVDNLLFAPDDAAVFVVDWQTLGIGAGALDVAYLIGTSVADPSVRAAQERGWVERYSAALRARGAAHDAERLWRDYRLYAFSGFVMAIIAAMNVQRTERGDEMFAIMAERPARQALSLDSLALL